MPPIVVFDTNVLFSAAAWKGRPHKCLGLARLGTVEGVTCIEILEELAEKLQLKLSFTTTQATDTTVELLTFLRLVSISGTLRVVAADPDDDKVLECASAATADFIVTGDHRHLIPMKKFQGVSIVTSAAFLSIVAPEK